ncbi:MAG: FtsX-like permease family protein [Pseudoflavonifractor sp.]|nr:FtsX-like permease family protein [Pseudoflavonifractor sp.]
MAVATLATVCVLSVFNGFASLATGRLSLIDPELKAVPAQGMAVAGADSVAALLAELPQVEAAVATLEGQALAMAGDTQLPLTVKGVGDGYGRVAAIDSAIIDGDFALADPYGYPAMALSVGAAIDLGVHPDPFNPVALYAPRRVGRISRANAMGAFVTDSVLVAGVWQIEQSDYDASYAIVALSRARRLFGYTRGEASAIEIALAPGDSPSEAVKTVASALGPQWRVLTRAEQQTASFRMIAIEKWITFVMLAFILSIASFNVVSTLSMLIIEKRSDMATLRALGATPSLIGRVFLWEGWLISMLGGIAGVILGAALCLAQQAFGFIHLHGDPSHLSVTAYPVELAATDVAIVTLLVALIGLLVGLIASRISRRE